MKQVATVVLALGLATPLAAQPRPSVAPKAMQEVAPQLADYTDRVLFGDVWLRPELAPRDRSLVVLSVLIGTGKTAQMAGHLNRGLTNGIKPSEVSGLVTHLAFYTGWPNAVSALGVIEQVFTERKIDLAGLRASLARSPDAPAAPATGSKFAALTADMIVGDLWKRSDLNLRDRSLVTIAVMAANGDTGQLGEQVRRGLDNGLARLEITEALTHLAFYAGWPKATAALVIAEAAFAPGVQRRGAATPAPQSNFTGVARVEAPFQGLSNMRGASVVFEPGARTAWHRHPGGQVLVVTAGCGWTQRENSPIERICAGDVAVSAPGEKHWHGATATTAMTHVALSPADGPAVEWMEKVSDDQYRSGPRD